MGFGASAHLGDILGEDSPPEGLLGGAGVHLAVVGLELVPLGLEEGGGGGGGQEAEQDGGVHLGEAQGTLEGPGQGRADNRAGSITVCPSLVFCFPLKNYFLLKS